MRRSKWNKTLAVALSIVMMFSVTAGLGSNKGVVHAAQGINLLLNGDFEELDGDNNPSHWVQVSLSGSPAFTVDQSVYQSGTQSYKISSDSVVRGGFKQEVQITPEQQGKPFKLQAWMKMEELDNPSNPANAKAYVRYQIYNESGARIGAVRYLDIYANTTLDWLLTEAEITMPSTAVRIAIEPMFDSSTGAVWYDDIRLFEVLPDEEPQGPEEPPVVNLLLNGDFEELGDDHFPSNWIQVRLQAPASVEFSVDETNYYSGTKSYKLSSDGISRGGLKQEVLIAPEQQGKPFKLQAWMKMENLDNSNNPDDAKAYVRYQIYNESGARIGAVRYLDIYANTTRDWLLTEAEFTMPSTAVRIAIEPMIDNASGAVWYDDIRLFEIIPETQEPPAPGTNLLANGGFETLTTSNAWENGIAPVQTSVWRASGNPAFAIDEQVARTGSRSARITGEAPGFHRGAVIQETTAMQINKPYLVSGWVKTEDVSSTAYVRIQYRRLGQAINIEVANHISGTTDWTYFSRVIALPDTTENPDAPVVKLEAFLESGNGKVWFDDLSIKEHIPLSDFQLTPVILESSTGATAQIGSSFVPDDASDQTLVWTSSHPDTVAINQEGRITVHAQGYSIISGYSPELKKSRAMVVAIDSSETVSIAPYTGTVAENGELIDAIAANDSGSVPVALEIAISPDNGTITLNGDGSFKYYPNRGYSGTDKFVVKAVNALGDIKFGTAEINVAPLAKAPKLDLLWYSTNKETALNGMLGNVQSPPSNTVVWSQSGLQPEGQVTIEPSGNFQYIPSPGFIGYDQFGVSAQSESGEQAEGIVKVFVVPDHNDIIGTLNDSENGGAHPRVLATADGFEAVRQLIDTDPYMAEWFGRLQEETDRLLGTSPAVYSANGGMNGRVRDLLTNTALMYRLTGEIQYAERAIAEMEAAAAFPDWGGRHNNMLALTYIAYSTALAYDWLYDVLTAEQKQVIEDAVSKHVFAHALDWYDGVFRHNGEYNNINAVNNGSFGLTALAFIGEGGTIGAEAARVMQGTYHKLQQTLRFQTEDGTWPEGPSYWQYGMQPLYLYMAALETSLGEDYGLSELGGMAQSGYFPLHLRGPGGPFNFSDGDIIDLYPHSLWLADRYGNPEFAWHAGQVYKETGLYSPFYLLLYRAGMFDTKPQQLDRTFSGIEAITMRSGWGHRDDVYAAMRGLNETLLSHSDLDAGTFVFDALGERWAIDLGNENYNLPGFWQSEQGTRWTYYRKGTQGHNTMVINPLDNPVHMQAYAAPALLIDSESKPRGAFGILDMTERYPNDVLTYRRGMMLAENREQLIIQDELKLKKPSELYWLMHTPASISVIEGGTAAVLSLNDKKLYVKMVEGPAGATFLDLPAEPLPGTPFPDGQTINHGVSKLALHMNGVEEASISIWMVPLHEEEPLPQAAPAFANLDDWFIPDGELPAKKPKATVNQITVDGQPLAGFDPAKTYYEITVPFAETAAPRVGASSAYTTSIANAAGIPGKTYIYVSDPVNAAAANRYTVSFVKGPITVLPPEVNRWPVAGVSASVVPQANLGHTPDKTLDGDYTSRWTSEGKHWIQYDLGEVREVGAVSIAFFNGHTRIAYFTIETSLDGETWKTDYDDGQSSGITSEDEVFHFQSVQARYLRIVGLGNSDNRWNNIAETGIYRPVPVSVAIDASSVWESGRRGQLTAYFNYYDGSRSIAEDVSFSSSNSTIIAVDGNGLARALRPGSATLFATDLTYGLTGELAVQVRAASPPSPPIPPASGGDDEEHDDAGNDSDVDEETDNGEHSNGEAPVSFTDTDRHWAQSLIQRAAALNIVQGYPNGSFKPDGLISREEFTVMLVNALQVEAEGTPLSFRDNGQIGAWSSNHITKAVHAGIINGYENGEFRPRAEISRVELAAMLARSMKLVVKDVEDTGFSDDGDIPVWAKGFVKAVREHGIMEGRGNNRFVPQGTATRAEAVAVLMRVLDHKTEE